LATPLNDLVAVRSADQRQWVLVTAGQPGGGDFVAAPAVSPDGTAVAWLTWNHPDMPWDAAELWVGRLVLDAEAPAVTDRRRVAGGRAGGAAHSLDRAVSVCLPEWSPDGRLWWCDDADGWWHLRAAAQPGLPGAAAGDDPATAVPGGGEPGEELGEPRWVAGGRRYGFTDDGRVVITVSSAGVDSLWLLDPATGERTALAGPELTSVEYVAVDATSVAVIGSTADTPATVWLLDLSVGVDSVGVDSVDADAPAAAVDLRPVAPPLGPEWVSTPIAVTFPTGRDALAGKVPEVVDDDGEAVAHALVYLPRSGDHQGPPDELPPLVVRIHGGPTAAARPEFSTSVQFWTTRGFAVADVNYRGSTGFGRDFRDQLQGRWGVVDVEDCIAVTRYLAGGGLVDGERCVIRGGSAGGFTALAAVCFQRDWGADGAFAGACSLYGVTDLAALAADTHKFESRYLDGLVAPLPAGAAVYRERSPLFHADRLSRPVLLLQGSEDKVVPPAQAEVLVDALTANGVPHRYLLFEGEGHGFHRAETIVAALRAELEFYGEVLGFEPA
jgi:dipeptidyl aminopeptidase/acylaminoacyl peptidase